MSAATIERLQKIVNDETRSAEEREQGAEHILKLQGKQLTEPSTEEDDIKRIFDKLLDLGQIEQKEDARIAAENAEKKACPECFRRQPISATAGELCGHTPAPRSYTLASNETNPRRNQRDNIIDDHGNVIALGRQAGLYL